MGKRSQLLALLLSLLGCTVLLGGWADEEQEPDSYCLRSARVLPISGDPIEPGSIWIEKGKIRAVGGEIDLPDDVEVRDLGNRTILPGLVDGHSYLGGYLELAETVSAVTPEVRAADALDPFHPGIAAALAGGVTCHLLAPRGQNTLDGICAAIKPATGDGGARVLLRDGGLKISFSGASLRRDRRPTSRAGAVMLFREEAEKAGSGGGSAVLREALSGGRTVFIDARDRGEISTALQVMKEFGLQGALVHVTWGRDLAERIREAGASSIVGPLGWGDPREVLETPRALAEAGVRVAFGSDCPLGTQDSLLVTAALAVRHGMSREAALRALTLSPAEIAGVADQVGSLEVGKAADILVVDGDPLDLSTRVVEVILDGKTVYRAGEGKEAP